MIKTQPTLRIEQFFKELAQASTCALVIDYDSVLAPFSASTSEACPSLSSMSLLNAIIVSCRTQVAVVTERSARELLMEFQIRPRPEIWGRSGLERLLPDDTLRSFSFNQDMERAFLAIDRFLERDGLGKLVTLKADQISVCWDGLSRDEAREARACALRSLAFLRGSASISISESPNGIEARYRSKNVHRVLQMLMDEMPGNSPLAYLGSETSDAANFRTPGDCGLSVLVAPSLSHTDTDAWLRPPDELIRFLLDWVRARGGEL